MVLEEAAASTDTPFSESPPTSDLDPYAGDSNPTYLSARSPSFVPVNPPGAEQIYVNLSTLPQRWTLFGRSTQNKVLANGVQDSCRIAVNVLGRPVRQEEADAFAFHFSKSMQIGSWGSPAGIFLGTLQAYRGMKDFRFPGYKPRDTFNPNAFWPLSGPRARIMWHTLRFNAYWIVGAVIGQVFFGSYALSVGLVGRAKDTRLTEFNEALKERQKAGLKLEAPRRGEDRTAGQRQGETFEMARQRRAAQDMQTRGKRQGQQQEDWRRQDDDMSPTGGAFGQEFAETGSETGVLDDSQIKQWEGRPRVDARASATENAASDVANSKPSSPRARQRQTDDASSDNAPKQPGSAWERLRQQAAAGQTSSASGRSSSTSSNGGSASGMDAFDFSRSDEDKQLAKAEAQKDFDARVEREREGRDFEERAQGQVERRW